MGVASSPGPASAPRRSIRFSFTVMVTVPVLCLIVLWAAAVAFTPGGALTRHGLFSHSHKSLAEVALYTGGGLIVVLVAVIAMGIFAGRLARDISGLEVTARHLADEKLPQIVTGLSRH